MKEINGKTRLCGLIGYPVKHTLSPVIHNYLAEVTDRNLVYVPFEVAGNLDDAIKGAFALNVLGMNVTVPYKKDVMASLVGVDENARRIGAVNTLVRMENGYIGYNTDYLGLKRSMESDHVTIEGEDVVVLGAGGAANAVVYLCAQLGARTVTILNRTVDRAQQLARRVGEYFPGTKLSAMETKDYMKLEDRPITVIQTTSVGLHPNVDAVVIENQRFYKNIRQAVDIIYNPSETKFMKLVKENGGKAYNGLKMLLYQGVTAYELWNDVVIGEDVCQKLLKMLQEQLAETNIILIGFMGAGKTTLGERLSKELHMPFVDTDLRIEEEQQRAVSDIFEKEGEAYFRKLETKQLEKLIKEAKGCVISVGGGLPVQEVNQPLLKKLGKTIYLKASKDTLVQRLQGDTSRPLLQGGQLEQKIESLMETREAIYEKVADIIVETDRKSLEEVIKEVMQA